MPDPPSDCIPRWCGGTRDDPCRTARQTEGQLHNDELDALEEEDRGR